MGATMMIGLNLNVIRPTGTATNAKLPVVVWIYGGGFAFGSNAVYVSGPLWEFSKRAYGFHISLDGSQFVQTSVNINQPVIYVAMNYRFVETLPAKLTVRSSFM